MSLLQVHGFWNNQRLIYPRSVTSIQRFYDAREWDRRVLQIIAQEVYPAALQTEEALYSEGYVWYEVIELGAMYLLFPYKRDLFNGSGSWCDRHVAAAGVPDLWILGAFANLMGRYVADDWIFYMKHPSLRRRFAA